DEFDAYAELGLHLYYDSQDRLEFLETFGECPIHYERVFPLRKNAKDILNELAQLGLSYCYLDGLYLFEMAGFALYIADDIVLGVSVYRPGYYNELVKK